ncbi:MAG: iron ABC transporter permease [Chloroflexia bacterium]|nr:iron ABC transporter permease [Chloroflexia bacterium]
MATLGKTTVTTYESLTIPPGRVRLLTRRFPPMVFVVPALLVALLMLAPLVYLAIRATDSGSAIPASLFRSRTFDVTRNTALLALSVAVSASLIAVPLAWLTTRTNLPHPRYWSVVAALPLVIPSYVGALTIVAAMGPRGIVQGWLEGPFGIERLPSIYGFFGSWWALTLFSYPYVYLGVQAAFRGIDPALEEAARSLGLGPYRSFFRVMLPQLRPAIAAGALLSALYTVSDFGVVSLMRYDVFTRAIYVQYQSSFDRTAAASLALVLVAFTIVILALEWWVRGRAQQYRVATGAARAVRRVDLGRWKWLGVGYCGLIFVSAVVLPMAVLVYWLVRGTSAGDAVGRLWGQAFNSATVSLLAGVVTVALALPTAVLSVRYRNRFTTLLERQTYLGYALPGVAIALAFVYIGARYVPSLYQTIWLLLIGYAVRFLPQALGAERVSLLQISPRVEEASRTLGENVLGTLRRVTLRLARPGLLAGFGLVALTVMKELPVTMMLAPIEFETLATGIWQATQTGAYGRAAAPALILIAISAIPSLVLSRRGLDQAA